jgi:peptide/nickel transport system permease protein
VLRVLVTRLLQAAIVVWLVVTASFVLIRLAPGDPFFSSLEEPGVSAEAATAMRERFGYARPVSEQYIRYLRGLLRADLGWSHSRARPVREVIAALLPNTLLLAGTGLSLGLLFGVLLGAWQGWYAESPWSRYSDRLMLALTSVPEFILGLVLAMVFAFEFRLLPVSGMHSEGVTGLVDLITHLILPVGTLCLGIMALLARHQRSAMRSVRDAEFIRAARASGITERRIVWRHALRNALAPVLTVLGSLLGALASGTLLIERIFDWPGMGRAMLEAVGQRDYPLVSGAVLVTSLVVVVGTLVSDVLVAWANPRLRRSL